MQARSHHGLPLAVVKSDVSFLLITLRPNLVWSNVWGDIQTEDRASMNLTLCVSIYGHLVSLSGYYSLLTICRLHIQYVEPQSSLLDPLTGLAG